MHDDLIDQSPSQSDELADAALTAHDADTEHHRHIRSFVMRRGHISKGQIDAHARLLPVWGIPYVAQQIDPDTMFGRSGPVVLEIGFGMGETTAKIAAANPNTNWLGCEVYGAGVGALLKRIDEQSLTNIRIIQHDAVEVLNQMIAPDRLDGVHIYFPDPWPKKRHHKRRLIQPDLVRLLASRIRPGGYLHLATDWEPYAEQMLEVLRGEPSLANTCEGFAPRPETRPLTKFEARGLRLGYRVHDLMFKRI